MTPTAQRLARARRRVAALGARQWLAIGAVVLIVAALATALHPAVQKRAVLRFAAPHVDRLDVDRIHVLPWSATIDGLEVRYYGGDFAADQVALRFCLSSLLFGTINLKQLVIAGGSADLRVFEPPPTAPTGPFAGVFPTLDFGLGIALESVAADIAATLSETDSVQVSVRGGDIEPDAIGVLGFVVRFESGPRTSFSAEGDLTVDQLDDGLYNGLFVDLRASAALPDLAEPEHAKINLALKPSAQPPTTETETPDGETVTEPLPENIDLTVVQTERDGSARATFTSTAVYDGRDGHVAGQYTLTSNEGIAIRYLPDAPLPRFVQAAAGSFDVRLEQRSGTLLVDSETEITDLQRVFGEGPKVPGRFTLLQKLALSFDTNTVTVESLTTKIEDEQAQTLVDSMLPAPITIDLRDPAAFLTQPNTLMTIDIGGILLAWFDAMLPDFEIVSGAVTGDITVTTDEAGNVVIVPGDGIAISDVRIDGADGPLIENLAVVLKPRINTNARETTVDVQDIAITIGELLVASAKLSVFAPVSEQETNPVTLKLAGTVHVDPVVQQPAIAALLEETPLPAGLSVRFNSAVVTEGDVIRVDTLAARIARDDGEPLASIDSKQAFRFQTGDTGAALVNPEGEIAALALRDIDLAWLNPFSAPYTLAGRLEQANFTVTAEAGEFVATATEALRLSRLNVAENATRLVDDVSVDVRTTVEYRPPVTRIEYDDLRLSGRGRRMLDGDGVVTLTLDSEAGTRVDARGQARVQLNALGTQSVVATALAGRNIDAPLSTSFRYHVSHEKAATRIHTLDLQLLHDGTRYVRLNTDSGLTVKPVLAPGENLAQHAVGELHLSIVDLSPAVLADFVPMKSVAFDAINANLTLRSDGDRLYANSDQALRIGNVRLSGTDGAALLAPFDVAASTKLATAGGTLDANITDVSLKFLGTDGPALHGKFVAVVEPGQTIPLRELQAEFHGDLPLLLNQPAVLPGHGLGAGTLGTAISVERNGNITARTTLGELASARPLAVHTIDMPLNGNLRADGEGFDFSMPIIGTGKSGTSNAIMRGLYLPVPDKPSKLQLLVASDLFYLNDILATIDGIRAPKAGKKKTKSKKEKPAKAQTAAPVPLDATRDRTAFWDVLPYDTQLDFAFERVFYSDYVVFRDVSGRFDMREDKLTIGKFGAYFHDSPITLDGDLGFATDDEQPYRVDLTGKVQDFDLNQFFTELAPTKTSRVEGLFGVDFSVTGSSPNAAQFRNRLLLDLNMRSRDGLFRPLPPDSPLMIGASGALGIIGEGLSYIPTGGFGAGAVSRLVNFIAEIDYDSVDVRIRRDRSLDLKIERMNLLSPEIRMAATGTIDYVDGKDILDSPLELVANLNMVGKGAAILYSVDLLEDEQDKFGYWKGPEFRVSGSVTQTESNLAEIIERAGDGSVKGGITRPISGLIGNIKHRWFGNEVELDAAKSDAENPDAAPAP